MSGYYQVLSHSLLILFLALALAIWDPPNRWHAVAWMGRLVACPAFLMEMWDVRTTRTELRHRRILLHDSGPSGLPPFVRVVPRRRRDNRRLVQAGRGMVDSRSRFEREGAK